MGYRLGVNRDLGDKQGLKLEFDVIFILVISNIDLIYHRPTHPVEPNRKKPKNQSSTYRTTINNVIWNVHYLENLENNL